MDEESEELAVLLAAQGVIGKRVDQMESGFMMALDYMIQLAETDQDDKVIFQITNLHFSTVSVAKSVWWISAEVSIGGNQGDGIIPSYQKMPPTCEYYMLYS